MVKAASSTIQADCKLSDMESASTTPMLGNFALPSWPTLATMMGGCRARHQDTSRHGFADGSSGCQGRSSPALFVCLWLNPPCRSAKRSRILLTQELADQITDLPRFPQLKSLFQFRVPDDTFRDSSKEQATSVATEHSPGLVTARGSFDTL